MTHDIIHVGQIEIRFLLESADTHGAMSMFEFTVPAGAKVPMPHYHKDYDETIYGLAGVLTFTVAGRVVEIRPGECCFIPRGAAHGFNNHKAEAAKGLVVATPGLIGPAFFRDVAALLAAGGPPDIAALKAVMQKHGLVPVLPH